MTSKPGMIVAIRMAKSFEARLGVVATIECGIAWVQTNDYTRHGYNAETGNSFNNVVVSKIVIFCDDTSTEIERVNVYDAARVMRMYQDAVLLRRRIFHSGDLSP